MNILISACLLGEDVRYDGKNSSIAYNTTSTFKQKEIFMDIICNHTIYSLCPEVAGGLSIPREPAEIISSNKPFKILTNEQKDVTINFLLGAKCALDLCIEKDIKVALLKSKSPSCGNKEIYDGTFSGKLVSGMGMTTKLLEENGIKVFNEHQINELNLFLNPDSDLNNDNPFSKLSFQIK